jgi:4-hydroxybenzoate polyprenyltransferase
MTAFFTLIRWKNLLIILLTELIIKYALIDYFLYSNGLAYRMNVELFVSLVLSSIFIASAGYILNDIQDVEIDKVNANNRPLANGKIKVKTAKSLMYAFNIAGMIFAFYSAFLIKNPSLASFQLLIMALLYGFSISLKCKKLVGNIIIAFITASVPLLIWIYTIYDILAKSIMFSYEIRWMHLSVFFFMIFAFLTNWIRELIKDKEDAEADISKSCNTWAATVSSKSLKGLLIVLFIILETNIASYQFYFRGPSSFIIGFSVIAGIIIAIAIPKLIKTESAEDYHKLSNTMKGIMLLGLLTPLLLWI